MCVDAPTWLRSIKAWITTEIKLQFKNIYISPKAWGNNVALRSAYCEICGKTSVSKIPRVFFVLRTRGGIKKIQKSENRYSCFKI